MSKTPAPLDASLLGMPKGSAAKVADPDARLPPVPPVPAQLEPPEPLSVPVRASKGATPPQRPVEEHVETEQGALSDLARKPEHEPRVALTVRLPQSMLTRLGEAAHRLNVPKQEIVEYALEKALKKEGY